MKKLFGLLFLLPFIGMAQDCKLIRETDPFTKETKISTGFIVVNGGSLTIDADKKEVAVLFSINNTGRCFDNNSTAIIIFDGLKPKTSARNGGTMNCEGLFQFVFKNSASTTTILQRLMTYKISSIVFTDSNKKESTLTVASADQEVIMKLATCLINESKTLL